MQAVMEKKHERERMYGKIMMCGSFKGGVGKTASSWNLAYSWPRWEKGFWLLILTTRQI